MIISVLLFAVGLILLIKGGDWFVDGATSIAKRFHLPDIVVGATVVSIGTTLMLPATFVTGFFGMNTSGMFLTGSPWGTVEAGGVCFLFMVGTWLILKFSKLL